MIYRRARFSVLPCVIFLTGILCSIATLVLPPTSSERRGDGDFARFHFIDTASWLGTEYTPARAANSLWWARFDEYAQDVEKELSYLRVAYRFPALRVFLHALAWEHLGPKQHSAHLNRFLALAASNGMRVGIVLFDDAWNHGVNLPRVGNTGANATCVPTECCPAARDGFVGYRGCSNGCWFANPQDEDRGLRLGRANASYLEARFRPYVDSVVRPLVTDPRVLWWEVFNEPCEERHFERGICTRFQVETSTILKHSAYRWVKAIGVQQPVMSCWGDQHNLDSDILNLHLYTSNFSLWNAAVFAECRGMQLSSCRRGAVVTEAGARWEPGAGAADGSPLEVIHYLQSLRRQGAPFVPGVMLVWELMVGNTNTRWVRGPPCTAAGSAEAEPSIPWVGLLWPDGTPVSLTEAAAVRRYLGYEEPIYLLETFLDAGQIYEKDNVLDLSPGSMWARDLTADASDQIACETTFWPEREESLVRLSIMFAGMGALSGSMIEVLTSRHLGLQMVRRTSHHRTELAKLSSKTLGDSLVRLDTWNMLRWQLRRLGPNELELQAFLNPTHQLQDPKRTRPQGSVMLAIPGGSQAKSLELAVENGHAKFDYVAALPPWVERSHSGSVVDGVTMYL